MDEPPREIGGFPWPAFAASPPSERQALRELVALRATLDRVEALLVARARRNGASWADVGADLGITRQSAHRRHRRRPTAPLRARR